MSDIYEYAVRFGGNETNDGFYFENGKDYVRVVSNTPDGALLALANYAGRTFAVTHRRRWTGVSIDSKEAWEELPKPYPTATSSPVHAKPISTDPRDAEIARLTKERDEAKADAATVMEDLQRIVPELTDKITSMRAVVDAARDALKRHPHDNFAAMLALIGAVDAYDAAKERG